MIVFQAIKHPITLVGLTWIFWLYLSPQIRVDSNPADASKHSGQVELKAAKINNSPKLSNKVSSNSANTNKTSSHNKTDPVVEPNRLELDLSLRQVSLYQNNAKVASYPVAVGRQGWETPQGQFKVLQMLEKPTWINPFTDQAIPGGSPDNPLGDYWIGFWTNGRDWIGFHGTPSPQLVGQAVSHGCVRMRNEDIGKVFQQVALGTQVIVKP